MITKLYVQMYRGYVNTPADNCGYNIIDDVIMPKNKSKFWTAVTSLVFELDRPSKVQNVGHQAGY